MILAGDARQLQAVENGGGMSLLADALGYARLAEPVRFRSEWEQHASLRLRDGDTTVLSEYDQHARIRGGDPDPGANTSDRYQNGASADPGIQHINVPDWALRMSNVNVAADGRGDGR